MCGTEYAIDLHGDLAGILTVAAGKQRRISNNDPLLQQVKMMTESGDHETGRQDETDSDGNASSESGALPMAYNKPLETGEILEDEYLHTRKDKMVAGAGFEPTTFGL